MMPAHATATMWLGIDLARRLIDDAWMRGETSVP